MRRDELIVFIAESQGDKLQDFYNKSYDKLISLNTRIDKLTFYLIMLLIVYLISVKASITNFQIGPVAISDLSALPKLLPLLFAYVLFEIVITSAHKAEVFTSVKYIFLSNYKQQILPKELENDNHNIFTRIIMPFSYTTELSRMNSSSRSFLGALVGIILILPLFVIIFLPFFFEFYMLKELYKNYFNDIFGKSAFYITIWLLAFTLYYISSTFISNFKEIRKEKAPNIPVI